MSDGYNFTANHWAATALMLAPKFGQYDCSMTARRMERHRRQRPRENMQRESMPSTASIAAREKQLQQRIKQCKGDDVQARPQCRTPRDA